MQRLGPRFLRKTYQFFLDDPLAFGFIALHDGHVVGSVVGRLGPWGPALDRYRRSAAVLALLTHPRLLFEGHFVRRVANALQRKRRPARAAAPSESGAGGPASERLATLAIIGVDPQYGQLRASDGLLESAEAFCRTRGMRSLRAGVQRSNVKSRFLYRRRGYVERAANEKAPTLSYDLLLDPSAS